MEEKIKEFLDTADNPSEELISYIWKRIHEITPANRDLFYHKYNNLIWWAIRKKSKEPDPDSIQEIYMNVFKVIKDFFIKNPKEKISTYIVHAVERAMYHTVGVYLQEQTNTEYLSDMDTFSTDEYIVDDYLWKKLYQDNLKDIINNICWWLWDKRIPVWENYFNKIVFKNWFNYEQMWWYIDVTKERIRQMEQTISYKIIIRKNYIYRLWLSDHLPHLFLENYYDFAQTYISHKKIRDLMFKNYNRKLKNNYDEELFNTIQYGTPDPFIKYVSKKYRWYEQFKSLIKEKSKVIDDRINSRLSSKNTRYYKPEIYIQELHDN